MGFELDDRKFRKVVSALALIAPSRAIDALNETGAHVQEELRRRAPGGAGGTIGRSITTKRATKADPVLRIGSGHPGARILHFGGVIKAGSSNADAMRRRRPGSRGKYLTIPLTKEARKKRARDFDNTFVFKSKKGNLLLAQRAVATSDKRGQKYAYMSGFGSSSSGLTRGSPAGSMFMGRGKKRKKRATPMRLLYVLKQSVTLGKRPYMFWSRADRRYLEGAVMRRIRALIRG